MAADMFGTPVGTRAAEEDQRENFQSQVRGMLGGLQAQEIMGKIAAQPAANDLVAAHARYYRSAAAEHEGKAAELQAMSALGREAATSPAAAPELSAEYRRKWENYPGGPLFSGAPPPPVADEDTSLAVPLEKLYNLAAGKGMVSSPAVQKIATQAATIRQKEASAARATAMTAEHQAKGAKLQLDLIGSMAMSAVDQPSYDRMRMIAAEKGIDLGELPESFEAAKPQLAQVITQSMEAKDVLAAQQKKLVDAANIKKLEAQAGASGAAASASAARAKVATQLYDLRAKNDGRNSASAKRLDEAREADVKAKTAARGKLTAAQQAVIDARLAARAAADAKNFPPLSASELTDPSKRIVGRTYSTPKGAMIWTKEGWTPLHPLPTLPAAKDEVDDDEDDD